MEIVDFSLFEKLLFVAATILEVNPFERALKPSYRIRLDCGQYGIKSSSAQITNYSIEELLGKKVIACINLTPRNIAGFLSEALITGFYNEEGKCILSTIDIKGEIKNGTSLS